MKILAVRSVPLSKETRDAWNSAGVRLVRRDRGDADIDRIVNKYNYEAILNLGGAINRSSVPVWNPATTISRLSHTRLRGTLDGFGMPEQTIEQPHWHKHGGFGGTGVRFHDPDNGWVDRCGLTHGEVQAHVEGTEYRAITVGDKVVQAFRKDNLEWVNGRHQFDWNWVGVAGIRDRGIIPLLKEAVGLVEGGERTVLGWDVIVDRKPYIIECNTSMGVNEATAQRIVRAMEEV